MLVKTIILVLAALGYVLGAHALSERALAEITHLEEIYTPTSTVASSAIEQDQQIPAAIPVP